MIMRNCKKTYSILIVLAILLLSCAGIKRQSPEDWAQSQLESLSLEQKVGQLFVYNYRPKFYHQDNFSFKRLFESVKKYKIGGISLASGQPYAVARTINKLQAATELPLLVMADIEWGISMRVAEGTTFLPNMAIGATGSEEYAYEMGKITALEARALGIHVGFVPVLDVNNNPDNIIINTRSFGEEPTAVARLGSAYIKGLQDHGVYATAKHYPGHGDTDVDSHLGLPVINATSERISSVELVPFKAAVEAGAKMVMVAHITYGGFPRMKGRPATLDPYFVENVLRKEWGFNGLVITDAMGMGGIVNNYWSGEAAVMAINSGMDMILMTPHFEQTYKFVLEAVKDSRISQERLNTAVKRILKIKYEQGLSAKKPKVNLDNIESVIAHPSHQQKAKEIAQAAMTLVRDDSGAFPLQADTIDSILVLTITDGDYGRSYENRLFSEVRKRVPVVKKGLIDYRSCQDDIEQIFAQTDSVQAILVGFFVRWGSYKGSVTLPDTTAAMLSQLFKTKKPMAVVSFGSPYLLRQVPMVPSYLCAYDTNPLAVGAALAAVFGEIPLNASLPVSIQGYYEVGDHLTRPAYPMELRRHIQDQTFAEAYQVIEKAIEDSVFPGAQIAIIQEGELIVSRAFGRQTYDPKSPAVIPETIYDIASVTKVAATSVVAMTLYEKNMIRLDIPVRSYLPQFKGNGRDSVTIRHLLTHSAGLKDWDTLWLVAQTKQQTIDYICQIPLEYVPGDSTVYSDLGIILLNAIFETVAGKSIDQLAKALIYSPLGTESLMYTPPSELLPRIAPTEIGGSMNRGLIHGEVHDENTHFLKGISTHAGLFSTAEDLAVLAQMLLNGGIYRHHRFFQPQTIIEWTARQNLPSGSERALGWDTPSDEESSAGDHFSPGSYGHLGFTGTSLWIDPNREIAIVLLSNRVHPSRERGGMNQVRRDFHNAAMRALLGEGLKKVQEAESITID
jgi:beta-glucosidase-like glycosyl hydrolase/CubicO group peptidase (beta-lactamase class C family)